VKPRESQPASTPEHREHFGEVARRAALELAQALGSGELDGESYRGLPVGARHCQPAVVVFLDTVERLALAVFDRAVEARDLPTSHNIRPMRKRA
jgi:hypothetical protein